MTDLAFKSARQLASMVRRKKIGSLELLDHYLQRVERYNPQLNAIVATDIPRARKRARAADRALAKGDIWGPLHGVPMTVKESHRVAGLPSTWGSPALVNNIPAEDGLTVQRWTQAGVTLFGKTNIPLMLSDLQSWNEVYGTTNNPWDITRTPGGSSGGAAAAVAAGLSAIEMGSDIASSIRNPAHFCGIYGHKPTYGICPTTGHSPFPAFAPTDISCVGPMARTSGDLALGLEIMAGPDAIDANGYALQLPPPRHKNLCDFKIAVMDNHELAPVADEVRELLQKLAAFLRKQKVKVDASARPAFDIPEAIGMYQLMVSAAMNGRCDEEAFQKGLQKAKRLKHTDTSVIANFARGAALYHRQWLELNEQRHRMRWQWHEFFQTFDLFLCPVLCTAAFPHDRVPPLERFTTINGRTYPAMTEIFWAGISGLFHLPATVAPIGFTRSGLPVGVQIVGPQFGDRMTIHFAKLLEQEYQSFIAPPGYE